jgi:LysM repeat protein
MSRIEGRPVPVPAEPKTEPRGQPPRNAGSPRPPSSGDGVDTRPAAGLFDAPRGRAPQPEPATLPTAPAGVGGAEEATLAGGGPGPRPAVHVVQQGETLYSLSVRYGVSVAQLRAANGLHGDTISIDDRLTIPGHVEITVASRQTLYSLARTHGTDVESLSRKNGLAGDALAVGQKLIVPGEMPRRPAPEKEGKHYVREGETLWSLSRRYDTTPEAFRRVNPEIRGNLIVAGTYIQIPNRPYVIREGTAKPEVPRPVGMTPAEQKAALAELRRLVDRGPDDVFNRTLQKLIDESPQAAARLVETVSPYWRSGSGSAVAALREDFAETRRIIDDDVAVAVQAYRHKFESTDPRAGFLLFMFSRLLPTSIPLKGDMIRTILKAPVWQVEEDLQEMAAMLGEPPPAFRQVYEDAQGMLSDVLSSSVHQLKASDEEKRAIIEAYATAYAEALLEHLHEQVPELGPSLEDVNGENLRHLAVKALTARLLGSLLPGGKLP